MEQVLMKSKHEAPAFDTRAMVIDMIEELMMNDDDIMTQRIDKLPEALPSLSESIDLLKIER